LTVAVVSIVLTCFSGFLVFVGLIPCFGWVNWTAIPLCALAVTSGLVGLFTDRDPVTQRMRGVLAHAFAIGTGGLLILVAIVRCAIGLGTV
jgi:hypothetical protein